MASHILIENGSVIDGTGVAPFPASVLLSDDRINAIGVDADNKAAGLHPVQRIDASGCTVMPGLIDAHCHLTFDDAASNPEIFHQRRHALSALVAAYNAKKLIRAGVTGILDPDSVHECSLDLRTAINAGVVEGPRMACGCYALINSVGGTAGNLIANEGVTGYYKVVRSADEIINEVRRQIKVGADWIKVHVSGVVPHYAHLGERCSWTQDELDLVCAVAHDMGVPVMGHCRGPNSTFRAAKAGFDLIFHATGMEDAALEMVIERKIPICPSLTFQANLAEFGHLLGTDAGLISLFERELTDAVEPMKHLIAAGVQLISGSESGFSMVPYGEWHYRELEVFVRYFDMTPVQAIQSATQAGAFALKMADDTGVIAAGKKADVLCIEGDPATDITVLGDTAKIRHVFIDGRAMDLSPLPRRKRLPEWHLPSMGKRLTRAFAIKA